MHYNPNILHKLWNTHIICLFFCGKIPFITQYSSFFVPAERWENNAFPTRVGKIPYTYIPITIYIEHFPSSSSLPPPSLLPLYRTQKAKQKCIYIFQNTTKSITPHWDT